MSASAGTHFTLKPRLSGSSMTVMTTISMISFRSTMINRASWRVLARIAFHENAILSNRPCLNYCRRFLDISTIANNRGHFAGFHVAQISGEISPLLRHYYYLYKYIPPSSTVLKSSNQLRSYISRLFNPFRVLLEGCRIFEAAGTY